MWSWQTVAQSLALPEFISLWNTRAKLLEATLNRKQEELGRLNVVREFGADPRGLNDSTDALQRANDEAEDIWLPIGTYKYSQDLVITKRWLGVPWLSVLKPTSLITRAVDLRTGAVAAGELHGVVIDGTNAGSGKTGLDIGTTTLVDHAVARYVQVKNFAGAGAYGVRLGRAISSELTRCYVATNYVNLYTDGGDSPTNTKLLQCAWRAATTKGAHVSSAFGLDFDRNLFEANGEEGLYFQNGGGNATEIDVHHSWFESNWLSLAAGALRHAQYDVFVDGANGPAGTIRPFFRHTKHGEGVTGARAMHLTNATGFVIDNCKVANEAGQILVDGTSYGRFPSWQPQNGDFRTTVTNTSGAIPDVTGSRGGNAALANLLTLLATDGVIKDSTTA